MVSVLIKLLRGLFTLRCNQRTELPIYSIVDSSNDAPGENLLMTCLRCCSHSEGLEGTWSTRPHQGPDEEAKTGEGNCEGLQCDEPSQLIGAEEGRAKLEAPVEEVGNHLHKVSETIIYKGARGLTNLVVVPEDEDSELCMFVQECLVECQNI